MYKSELGYTVSDMAEEMLKNNTYPNLDEIIAESLGIWLEENDYPEDAFSDESGEPLDFTYKFDGFDTHAMFTVTFENGQSLTYPVPLFYFDSDDEDLLPPSKTEFPEFIKNIENWITTPAAEKYFTTSFAEPSKIEFLGIKQAGKNNWMAHFKLDGDGWLSSIWCDPKNNIIDFDRHISVA